MEEEEDRLFEGQNSTSEPRCELCVSHDDLEKQRSTLEDDSPPPSSANSHGKKSKTLLESTIRALSRKFSVGDAGSKCDSKKVCLICLEELDEESFRNGEAIALECDCKGDSIYRHTACAVKWAQVKGSTICDICKAPIKNLPDIEHLPPPDLVEPMSPNAGHEITFTEVETVPPALDLSFDFLRITWIATIICVLFVQLDLQESLWIGSMVGLSYILMIKLIQCCSNRFRRYRNTSDASGFGSASDTESSPQARFNATAWYGIVTPPV